MTLKEVSEDIEKDAEERLKDLSESSDEYRKQAQRVLEAKDLRISLEVEEDVRPLRSRLRELFLNPTGYPTFPPTKK